jgi:hypothetical protein
MRTPATAQKMGSAAKSPNATMRCVGSAHTSLRRNSWANSWMRQGRTEVVHPRGRLSEDVVNRVASRPDLSGQEIRIFH